MKNLVIASAILAASVSAADAKCSKKALNGSWSLAFAGQVVGVGTAAGGTFTFSIGGNPFTLTLSGFSSTKCKGSGTGSDNGSPFTFTMASESIPGSSKAPNHLLVNASVGGSSVPIVLKRQ
jgi:hypothetical protein